MSNEVVKVSNQLQEVIDDLQAYFLSANVVLGKFREPLPHITCRDGAKFSVQVGDGLYCSPRNNQGPWDSVEIMTISNHTPMNWEDDGDVAGYVPIESIAQEILDRGFLQLESKNGTRI